MKKTLLDDIVSHIAESVVQRFVKSRKVKEASQQEARGKEPVSIEVLDDFHLDGQAVHQQAASFRISESDPLGEFSMFRSSLINMLSKQHNFCMFSNHKSLESPPIHYYLYRHLHAQGVPRRPRVRQHLPQLLRGKRGGPLPSSLTSGRIFFSQREGSFFHKWASFLLPGWSFFVNK